MAKKHIWRQVKRKRYREDVGARHCRMKRLKLTQLSEAQGHRCCYCIGETFLLHPGDELPKGMSHDQRATLEHLTPQSKAVQTNRDSNLVMACAKCNVLRGCTPPMAFYNRLRLEPGAQLPVHKAPMSAKKFLKLRIKQQKTLAICLVAAMLWPEDLAYWGEKWVPPKRKKRSRGQKRAKNLSKIRKAMATDPRRLAA